MLPDATYSCTKSFSPTTAPMGTICIILVCFTTRMNPSAQLAQACRSLFFVEIIAAYSWAWGRNTHCRVFLHLSEQVNISFLAGRRSRKWMIWFSWFKLKYDTGKEGFRPWKVLLRSFSSLWVYWTHKLWASGMIPWLAFVYFTLQSSHTRSIEVGLWNGWR